MAQRRRHLLKALSYRVLGSLFAFLLAYLLSNNLKFSLGLLSLDAVGKIALYYAHERVWDKVKWGTQPA
jgi:uncharacterized membrane protein